MFGENYLCDFSEIDTVTLLEKNQRKKLETSSKWFVEKLRNSIFRKERRGLRGVHIVYKFVIPYRKFF